VKTECKATCDDIQSGNVVIIQGSTLKGGISFNQKCEVKLQCEIQNNLETDVATILDAAGKQTAITANGFPDFNFNNISNSFQSSQIITNTITNIIDSSCTSQATQNQNSNYTYVQNSNIEGSIQFNQTADVNASCTLTNRSSLIVSNKASAKSSQSAVILGTTGLIIALVVVVIIIVVVIFLIGKLKKSGGGGSGISSEDVATAIAATSAANTNAGLTGPGVVIPAGSGVV